MKAVPAARLGTSAIERVMRQRTVVAATAAVLPPHALLWHSDDTVPYECGGLTAYRERPLVVWHCPRPRPRSARCCALATRWACRW